MQKRTQGTDTKMNTCRIICDDGWFVKAPTYAEAKALSIKLLVDRVGEIDEIEAEFLFDHDVHHGIIQIIHHRKGTVSVH